MYFEVVKKMYHDGRMLTPLPPMSSRAVILNLFCFTDPWIIKVHCWWTPAYLWKRFKRIQYFTFGIFADPLDPLHGPLGVHGPPVKNLWSREFWSVYLNHRDLENVFKFHNIQKYIFVREVVVLLRQTQYLVLDYLFLQCLS